MTPVFIEILCETQCQTHASQSGVQTQSTRAAILLGFLSYQAENAFTKESGIHHEVVYLVDQKSQLD